MFCTLCQFHKFIENCLSIIRDIEHNNEHNRENFGELLLRIIPKKSSIIDMYLG